MSSRSRCRISSVNQFPRGNGCPPRLLVLNACDTLNGADELLSAVPVVVAMSDKITDTAAVVFATKFYSAIANAQSIGSAIKQARAMLSMLASAEDHLPEYVSRDGIERGRSRSGNTRVMPPPIIYQGQAFSRYAVG
ncbi:CHAT domain-containing protein [Ochrobactrum sp. MYb379]|uniref:CHAT domain-containing protein n=1 Tax=Ochrobactrum sp. MYb379 TaxID=2745275 RepID=UPI00309A00E3